MGPWEPLLGAVGRTGHVIGPPGAKGSAGWSGVHRRSEAFGMGSRRASDPCGSFRMWAPVTAQVACP